MAQQKIEISVYRELINKLLDLPCLSTPASRQTTTRQLSKTIQYEVPYAKFATSRQEVEQLVATCLKYQGGWPSLLETINYFDRETLPWQELQTFLAAHDLTTADTPVVTNLGKIVNLDNLSTPSSNFQPQTVSRQVNIGGDGNYNEFDQATLNGHGGNNLLGSIARDVTNNDYRQGSTHNEYHAPVTIYNAPPPTFQNEVNPLSTATTLPATLWNIPYTTNPNFMGREEELATLGQFLEGSTHNLAVTALHGLGGMGKTRLVVEYSYRYREQYPYIWWLRSEEAATLAADYAELALKLGLAANTTPDQPTLIKLAKDWLSENQDWLLIFDNAPNPQEIYPYLPKTKHGAVIIASRFADWSGLTTKTLAIKPLANQAAAQLLLSRSRQNDQQAALALAEELGELPLALTQAGAYCAQTSRSLESYLELFRDEARKIKLLALGQSEDYNLTVATTWQLAIKQITLSVPAALELLNLCSFLSPDGIPLDLMAIYSREFSVELAQLLKDELELDEMVKLLRHYSLIEISHNGSQISLHRLLQTVIRANLTTEERQKWFTLALRFLNWAFPWYSLDYKNWEQCALLLPHVERAVQWGETMGASPRLSVRLLNQVGVYFKSRGLLEDARRSLEKALAIAQAHYGGNHADFANVINNLGGVLQDLKLFQEARVQFEEALSLIKENDKLYPTALSNVASILQDLGQSEKALVLNKRALEVGKTIYGPNHPELAITLNNIATILEKKGQYLKARSYYEQIFQLLTPNHYLYPGALNNLAYLLLTLGKPEKAQTYLEELVQNLPENHPLFEIALGNLGTILQELGQLEAANKVLERSLELTEQTFGLKHYNTAKRLGNLAGNLLRLGKLERAKTLYEQALDICKELYGPDDPVVAERLTDMSQFWVAVGQPLQVKKLDEEAIAILEKAFGPDHPNIAMRLNDLGFLLKSIKHSKEAREFYERALAIATNAHGLAHPDVAKIYNNLGTLLYEQGDWVLAQQYLTKAVKIWGETLGWDHPNTKFGQKTLQEINRALLR